LCDIELLHKQRLFLLGLAFVVTLPKLNIASDAIEGIGINTMYAIDDIKRGKVIPMIFVQKTIV